MAADTISVAGTGRAAAPPPGEAATLAAAARAGGSFDAAALAARLGDLDSGTAETLRPQIEAQLTPVERGELARAIDARAANDNAAAPDPVQLGLDLGQMALDVAGLFDPTPISDGTNAVVSAGRAIGSLLSGDWGAAGGHALNGAISAVAIVPVAGDAAKLGKIGKWAETVGDAVGAVAHNPALRETLAPALQKVRDAIGAIPAGALDALPAGARESLEATKRQLDEFFSPTVAANAASATNLTARVGANSAEWTVNAAGQPTRVTATLSELQPSGIARGRDELAAQDAVRGRGLADDDAGHVIGHRFLGDQGTRNMFPQNFNFNRGAYKTMENEWAAWIQHGGTVKANVELIGGTAGRPAQVGVRYEVFNAAGERVHRARALFDNQAGQTFQRVQTTDIERLLR